MSASKMMPKDKILLLFDVDGTLTRPMQAITEDMKAFLMQKVKPLATLGIVGGSDITKIKKQMGEGVVQEFKYVFSENGLVRYADGKLVGTVTMIDHIGENLSQKFINFCLRYMSELTLPAKRGNFVEFRTGMMNISPIGRSCSMEERNEFVKYDNEHGVRRQFVEAMRKEFPDAGLQFSLGGQISVDVFPVGWDKTYCLQHLENEYEVIHFFGDRTAVGGNDYEIFQDPRTVGHSVTSPDDTKRQIEKVLSLNS